MHGPHLCRTAQPCNQLPAALLTSLCASCCSIVFSPSFPAPLLNLPLQELASNRSSSSCQSVKPQSSPQPDSASATRPLLPDRLAADRADCWRCCCWPCLDPLAAAAEPVAASRALSVASCSRLMPGVVISKCWYMSAADTRADSKMQQLTCVTSEPSVK